MACSDDALAPALGEQRERVAAGRMVARALDERRGVGRQDVGLGERDAVDGRHDHRGRQRREGQVGGAEALAAQVLAAVREQLGDEVELAPDRRLVLDLDPRADAERALAPSARRAASRGGARGPPSAARPRC